MQENGTLIFWKEYAIGLNNQNHILKVHFLHVRWKMSSVFIFKFVISVRLQQNISLLFQINSKINSINSFKSVHQEDS